MSATATPADVIAGRARWCVVHGDSAEVLPSIAASSVAAVVTDPPSGIAFMGAEWDKNKGGRAQWVAWLASILGLARAATKQGGRTFVWALPRTTHWTGCAVEDAGWSIENVCVHLFGSGWPKGASQLKPASEHWYLARNGPSTPLEIDACRVGTGDDRASGGAQGTMPGPMPWGEKTGHPRPAGGRYPPNAVFSHAPSCVREGVRKVTGNTQGDTRGALGYGGGVAQPRGAIYTDPDGHETVDAWTCADGCPVAELAMQSGEGSSGGVRGGETRVDAMPIGWHGREQREHTTHGDTGTAARFFPQFPADDPSEPFNAPLFRYEAKPSRAEKNAGCDELDEAIVERCSAMAQGPLPQQTPREATPQGNHHATVKGVALMAWLIRLITKPGDVVLDPFGGSFTTGVAAMLEGRRFIGIEREERYCKIGRARLLHAAPTREHLRTIAAAPIVSRSNDYGPLFAREDSR